MKEGSEGRYPLPSPILTKDGKEGRKEGRKVRREVKEGKTVRKEGRK